MLKIMSNRGKTTSHDRFHYFVHCDLFDEKIMKLNSTLMTNCIYYSGHKINSLTNKAMGPYKNNKYKKLF
jgi:hypothetical protein